MIKKIKVKDVELEFICKAFILKDKFGKFILISEDGDIRYI